ncbi:MAG: hypothetical protein ACJARD_001711 [Alphaproteobacteria bacterium]|jgi:hypothetical protein
MISNSKGFCTPNNHKSPMAKSKSKSFPSPTSEYLESLISKRKQDDTTPAEQKNLGSIKHPL